MDPLQYFGQVDAGAILNGSANSPACRMVIDQTYRNGVEAGGILLFTGIIIGAGFVASLWYLSKKRGEDNGV